MRKLDFAYAKTKAQISGAVTVRLKWIVQLLTFQNLKFQAFNYLM